MGLGVWNGKRHLPITPIENSWAYKLNFQRGMTAAYNGRPYSENPYRHGTTEHLAWSQGHNGARANALYRRYQ
jgi:hypothetical protein